MSFDCEDEDLNDFFYSSAINYQKELMAVTYVLENTETSETVAFFCLQNDKISAEYFDSNRQWKKKIQVPFAPKILRDYPAIKIGRFGVSKNYKNQKIGISLISILKVLFISENRTGCSFITVDAYSQSLGFYEKNGFVYFSNKDVDKDTRQMYFDLHVSMNQFNEAELNDLRLKILPNISIN